MRTVGRKGEVTAGSHTYTTNPGTGQEEIVEFEADYSAASIWTILYDSDIENYASSCSALSQGTPPSL